MTSLKALNDQDLLNLVKEGNASAFDALYSRYWDKVLQLAYRKTGDLMEAENIIQDIFVSIWKRRESLQVTEDFNRYLFVSVKYRVLKVLAKRGASTKVPLEEAGELTDHSTQEYLEFAEIQLQLEKITSKLPEKSRLVYLMKIDDRSYREIAEALNITEKAVDAHLLRARRKLRIELGNFLNHFLL